MNVLVLNGSPKGKNSVTVQTGLYLEKRNPSLKFEYLHIGQQIRSLEKDFSKAKEALEKAEMVIFIYPVYTCLIPYQTLRFIELMHQHEVDFQGKIVTQISTSKHFFDTTAHKFLEENIGDLKGNYVTGLSSDMEDLLEEKGRRQADCWFDKVLFDGKIGHFVPYYPPAPPESKPSFQVTGKKVEKKGKKDLVLLTTCSPEDENLRAMIDEFVATCPHQVREVNVRDFPFKGGCIGCLQCTVSADCIYKDGFQEFLRDDMQKCDGILYAFTIENHYAHSSFKCFDDRQFCDGHRSVNQGMPVGYILSGNYGAEFNLQVLIEGRCEVGKLYLSGVATDQGDTAQNIHLLQESFCYALDHTIEKPSNFYGVGGTKIFRDMVYLMRGMMKADHKYYKKHGLYDFPHNQKKKAFQMKMVGGLMSLPNAEEKMKGKMSEYILMPYTKLLDNTVPKK